MKKLLLILMLVSVVFSQANHYRVWSSAGSTDMNLATNYSGSGALLTTDTLVFNNTSVVNATATANLSVAHVDIQSTYSGNWVMTGYTLTLNNGGLLRSGSGTFTLGNGIIFNGNGKLYTNATSGTNTSAASCVITINGRDTFDINKSLTIRQVIVNNSLCKAGSSSLTFYVAGNYSPINLSEYSELIGGNTGGTVSGFLVNANVSLTSLFSIHPTAKLAGIYGIGVSALNPSGNITINIPKFISTSMTLSLAVGSTGQTGTVTYNMTDTLSCRTVGVYSFTTGGGGLTFNTNGYYFSMERLDIGSQYAGCRIILNGQNTNIDIKDIISSRTDADSTILNLSGATIQNSNIVLKPKQRIDGNPTFLPCTDLFMGHSMLVGVWYRSIPHNFEKTYRKKVYVNKSISGSSISNINSRVDSCLTAYTPKRVYLWTGTNDLNYEDVTKFDSAVAWYFAQWSQIISKVKLSGVDSIYIVDMPPRHDVGYMSATKQANFKRFNSALKDSCRTNGLFFIATYDSLLQPGYTDRINHLYSTDGLHPNFTQEGVEYCAYLFSLAQGPTVTFRQSVDTLKLVCGNNQNVESWQWYKDNVAISGATDSVLSVVVDSTSATKSVYYCEISNGAENKKVGDWTIERKANSRTVSRRNKYKSK